MKSNTIPLEFKTVEELTPTEKMELVAFASTSYYKLIKKIMEWEVIEQRDAAMVVDPSEETKQRAAMTEAHAMAKFYARFRKTIDVAIQEHLGEIQDRAIEAELADQSVIEELIVRQ